MLSYATRYTEKVHSVAVTTPKHIQLAKATIISTFASVTEQPGFVLINSFYRRMNVFGGHFELRVNNDETWSLLSWNPDKKQMLHSAIYDFTNMSVVSASGSYHSNMHPHIVNGQHQCVESAFRWKAHECILSMKQGEVTLVRVQDAHKGMQNNKDKVTFWGTIETPTKDNFVAVWKTMLEMIESKYAELVGSDEKLKCNGKAIKALSGSVPWSEFGKKWDQTSLSYIIMEMTEIWGACPEMCTLFNSGEWTFVEITPFENGMWGLYGDLNAMNEDNWDETMARIRSISAFEATHSEEVVQQMIRNPKLLLVSKPGATKNTLAYLYIAHKRNDGISYTQIKADVKKIIDDYEKAPFPDHTIEQMDMMVNADTTPLRKIIRDEANARKTMDDAIKTVAKAADNVKQIRNMDVYEPKDLTKAEESLQTARDALVAATTAWETATTTLKATCESTRIAGYKRSAQQVE